MEKRSESPLRALHGQINVANQMETLAEGLNHHGVYCRTITKMRDYLSYKSKYPLKEAWPQGASPDEILNFLKEHCIPEFDLFNFHWGYSFVGNYADLRLFSEEKKPVVMHHWGSEVRSLEKALKINPYAKVKPGVAAAWIDKHLRLRSQYITHCIVQDAEMYLYVKDYYEKIYVVPVMIDLSEYEYTPNEPSDRPLIVHAPTHVGIKGTETVIKVMGELQEEFEFDFKLIQGYSHDAAKKLYAQADLVIDQLHLGIYGMVSIETMAMGKPVVCYVSDFMLDHYPDDLPVINANPDTFLEVMKSVLKNKDALPEIGKKSRKFVEERHDMLKNSLEVKRIYEQILS